MKTIRLFQVTQLLRQHKLITAQQLAEQLEVSRRTIYRDVQQLLLSGVPINGEAGAGYWLEPGFDFPPLMFSEAEVEALAFGMRLAMKTADKSISLAAQSVLHKINESLPQRLQHSLVTSPLDIHYSMLTEPQQLIFQQLRQAIKKRQVVSLHYSDEKNQQSERSIRALELSFWGKVWTVTAWCEKRHDFRNFRVDRISALQASARVFQPEKGKTLQDYYQLLSKK